MRNCANHMLLLMFNIHCGPNMCIAYSGFNGYGMIMYHLLVLVVPSLFEIITWNKAIALEALERCGHSEATCCSLAYPTPQDSGSLFKLASDRGFLTYTGKFGGERHAVPHDNSIQFLIRKVEQDDSRGSHFLHIWIPFFSPAARCSFRFPGMW